MSTQKASNTKSSQTNDCTGQKGSSSIKMNVKPIKKTVIVAAQAMNLLNVEDDHHWEELQKLEKRRRSILLQIEEPWWKILLHWDGTVVRNLAFDFLFWFTMAVYIAVRVQSRYGIPKSVTSMGSVDLSLLGGFLTFFLVFYVNQSHTRYFNLYAEAMKCKGRVFDCATLAVTALPFEIATRLIRYMNAAHAAGFTGLSKTYDFGNFFKHINKSLGLLTPKEMERMHEIDLDSGGSCNRELIVWCMQEIHRAHREGIIDNQFALEFRDQLVEFRAAMGQLFNAADLPIPFFYVHFITLLTSLYLPLFAVSTALKSGSGSSTYWTADLIGGLVVLFQSIFVIGLRILGQKVSDPFGDDLIDLSVIYYVNFCWTHSNRILEAHLPPPASAAEEESIINQRKSIGKAWEHAACDSETGRVSKEDTDSEAQDL